MEPTINDLIKTSIEGKPSEFQAQANEILGQRVLAAIERRREEMAHAVFAQPEEVPDEVEISDSPESEDEINSDETEQADAPNTEEPNGQDS